MRRKKQQREDTWREVVDDPRRGKRVFCVLFLPEIALYGTIQTVLQNAEKKEVWKVLGDHGSMITGFVDHFEVYEYKTEFQAGDQAKYHLDRGGYWNVVILHAQYAFNCLRFVVKVVNGQEFAAVHVQDGHTFAARIDRLEMV